MAEVDLAAVALQFDGRRLAQARRLRSKLKADLAVDVDLTPAAVGQFERGVTRPKPATVAKMSLALGVPPAFFTTRPIHEIPEDQAHFRKLRATSKRARDEARAQVELLADLVAFIERRVRLPDVALPRDLSTVSPEEAATELRARWQLGLGPIASAVGLLERKGTVVARLHASSDEIDAFSCWMGGRPFVILASNKHAADRSRFDAAHELGHLILHQDVQPGDPASEQEAHRFAAELLMPAAAIRSELPPRLNWRRYLELKGRWGVSMAALIRRARDLDVIADTAYRRAMIELGRKGWRTREPDALVEPEQPELIARALMLLDEHRQLSLAKISGELSLSISDAQSLATMAEADRQWPILHE